MTDRDLADELAEALRNVVRIIDAAGLSNLSNGVQLGQTSWYVKASDRMGVAHDLLSSYDEARSRGESRDTRTTYHLRCGWCGAYEGTVDPSEPCAKNDMEGPHQFDIYEPTPETDHG